MLTHIYAKKTNRSQPLWTTFTPHSSVLSQHTCCQDHRSQRPCGHSGPLWMEEWAKPWPRQTADLAEPLCQGGYMWHHPCRCMGSRAGWGLLCTQSQGTPVHVSRIILPCHGYCSTGLDALRQHSRTVRSCGTKILPMILGKTTLEQVKQPMSLFRPLVLGWLLYYFMSCEISNDHLTVYGDKNRWISKRKNSPCTTRQPCQCWRVCLYFLLCFSSAIN